MTIPTLMVVTHRLLDESSKFRNYSYQVRTPDRVRLHQRRFLRRKTPLLAQQRSELLINLAYVVQKRGGFDLLHFSRRETKLYCNCP